MDMQVIHYSTFSRKFNIPSQCLDEKDIVNTQP